jgi:hypothetical protein
MLPDSGLVRATDAACVAPDLESDQAYLVATARPGSTMLHQGSALAITRLHPIFVRRLAEGIREARDAGLPSAGIFSAYRPPAFGVGRFSDKFNSLHTYGLAVDMLGIGGPGSSDATVWHEIAARHGIVCPYGANNRREWNHCQPTRVKIILAGNPLRGTVSPQGPVDLKAMFAVGAALVSGVDAGAGPPEPLPAGDQSGVSRAQAQPRPQRSAGWGESIGTRHDPGLPVSPYLHQAHGQPKGRIIAEDAPVKSGPVKKDRTSSLVRRDSFALNPAAPTENALAKRIEEENARVNRLLKGICRGC